MFAKLLKHEFRTSAKSLGLFSIVLLTSCAISFLFSIFLYTSNPIQDNNIWNTNFPMWYSDDAVFRFAVKPGHLL